MTTTTSPFGPGACTLKLLPSESLEQFNAFARSVWEHYQPSTAYEEMLTNFVVITSWRHRRYLAMEESVLAEESRIAEKRPSAEQIPSQDATVILSTLVKDNEAAQSVKLVLRYVAAARRDANNAVANLKRVQQERLARPTTESEDDRSRADVSELPVDAVETQDASPDVQDQICPEPGNRPELGMTLSRTERRALERRLRKAERKALRNAPGHEGNRFVSHAA
jgi:hypothetical protein